MMNASFGIFWVINLIVMGALVGLVIYVLLLAIKALKIYIAKNQNR